MDIHLGWAEWAVIGAFFSHAIFTIWSTATFKTTIVVKIDNLVGALTRLDKELEKRDVQISATWKKIDGINDRLVRVETKCDGNHKEDK